MFGTKFFANSLAGLLMMTSASQAFGLTTGAETFKAKCAVCHGQDGAGNTPLGQRMKARDLRSAEVQQQSDEAITTVITNGQKVMPAFGKNLDAGKIKDLVTFVRSIATK